MKDELKQIKKKYGENMMHLCRKLFPSILEKKGILFQILSENFYYSKNLYYDIVENDLIISFKDYIYKKLKIVSENKISNKDPFELMNEKGYKLYECKTQSDIMEFCKYYAPNEMLCTFKDRRLNNYYVFFAVKENADKLCRKDFKNPKRQDEYGTSVISLQFSKGNINTLSIKNRYNHTVINPDATFSNNLENIVEGLTYSFEKKYGLNINQNVDGSFELPNYILANDGKWYRYNYEINNIYYCENNIIIKDHCVDYSYIDKSKYILFDYFILDLVNKKIIIYDKNIDDYFLKRFKNIENIEVTKNNEKTKTIKLTDTDNTIIIKLDKNNKIISYIDNDIKSIGDNFLYYNTSIDKIEMNNLVKVGNDFLKNNISLEKIKFNNLEEIGDNFVFNNEILSSIELENVKIIGNDFLSKNENISKLYLKNIKEIGNYFMFKNENLKVFIAPNIKTIGDNFLSMNYLLDYICVPRIVKIGNGFLENNEKLLEVYFPYVEGIGDKFLSKNIWLRKICIPNIKYIGNSFLYKNQALKEISFDKLKVVGDNFLCSNRVMNYISCKQIELIGDNFLYYNKNIEKINFQNLKNKGKNFMLYNELCKNDFYDNPKINILRR